ncbi:hypothetical protein HY468_03540 [Candidatus Roizmanbacteria bacterium]|nr:hypothetical protein [Candidatus Roizmanbacteria bacterium]
MKKHLFRLHLGIVVILSIPTILPLFHDGFFPMHDDTQVVRVQQMSEALYDGQFPVRWVKDLGYGYGYPIFNFYAPLPDYIGSLFDLFGFSPLAATKIMIGIGMVLAAVSMYLLGAKLWGPWGGVISSIAYQYAPYHAVQLFVRGAIGELYAYAFVPLAVYGFVLLFTDKQRVRLGLLCGVSGYAGIILSHNITALLFTLMLGIVGLIGIISGKRWQTIRKEWKWFIAILLFAFGMSAFFWLPAIAEKDVTVVDQITKGGSDYHLHFLYLDQLWDSPWGFAGSAAGRADGMSFKIGKVHVLLGLLGFTVAFWSYLGVLGLSEQAIRKNKKWLDYIYISAQSGNILIWLTVGLLLFSIIMTLEVSTFIWESIPILSYVQFPWRFLVFIMFFVSIFIGGITVRNKDKSDRLLAITTISVLFLVGINVKYFRPQEFYRFERKEYEDETFIKWEQSKISDEYLPKGFYPPTRKDQIALQKFDIKPPAVIESQLIKSNRQKAVVTTSLPATLIANTVYFPGWKVRIDNKEYIPSTMNGIMTIPLIPGTHEVELFFTNTPVRIVANLLSLFSLVALFGTIRKITKVPYAKKTLGRDSHSRV